METIHVKKTNSNNVNISVKAGNRYLVIIENTDGIQFLEFQDNMFRTNSAVLLPCNSDDIGMSDGENSNPLSAIIRCLEFVKNNQNKKILVAGHTDTAGNLDYNKRLSVCRAKSVLCSLIGDAEGFADICQDRRYMLNKDYNQILAWAADSFGWDCHPGEINDNANELIVNKFRSEYNSKGPGSTWASPIASFGGAGGKEIWIAYFNCYETTLMEKLGVDIAGLKSIRDLCQFSINRKWVGCNEYHPREATNLSDFPCDSNRRVEVLFFDSSDIPTLNCETDSQTCAQVDCILYDAAIYPKRIISSEANVTTHILDEVKLLLKNVTSNFAPSVETCEIVYRVEEGEPAPGSTATITVRDVADNIVYLNDDLPLEKDRDLSFAWNGAANDGSYPAIGVGPFSITLTPFGIPGPQSNSLPTLTLISDIVIEIADLDVDNRLVVNEAETTFEVCATVFVQTANSTSVVTPIPVIVEFTVEDPDNNNIEAKKSHEYATGKRLGKRGDPSAIYFSAVSGYFSSSTDDYRTSATVYTTVIPWSNDLGKAKINFIPSAVGGDTFIIKATVKALGTGLELFSKDSPIITIWRKLQYDNIYTMDGEAYLDTATTHDEIGPAFETTGSDGAFVLYERGSIITLPASMTVRYIGLYDASAPNRQANWPDDFSPALLETTSNQLNPTDEEINAFSDPTPSNARDEAIRSVHNKASLWFNAIQADMDRRIINWITDAGLTGVRCFVGLQYFHPKYSNEFNSDTNAMDGTTNFYPQGIIIDLTRPGSRDRMSGDPDWASWNNRTAIQGYNQGDFSCTFKNFRDASRLQILCRHEMGHATRFMFAREVFGPEDDHSSSDLMQEFATSNTFSNADSRILRGEL